MNNDKKLPIGTLVLTAICAVAIAVTGIVFQQSFFRILPLFISLGIGVLQSRASRYAPLIGSFNSILYGIIYIGFGLYANAANAFLVSFPFQLVTFLRWKKRAYKHSTRFQNLKLWHWCVLAGGLAVSFILTNFVLAAADSSYRILDNSSTLLGLAVSVLTVFAFREYTWLMLINGLLTIGLYVAMAADDLAQITYIIYAVHSLICVTVQFFCVRKLYREQKEEAQ